MAQSQQPTVVSCPGKVLLAGGFLVLDPAHQGLVISTASRFYTVVTPSPHEHDTPDSFRIVVKSPQFTDGSWEYTAQRVDGEWTVEVAAGQTSSPNSFVHLSLSSALLLASAVSPTTSHASLSITVVGANDFYSQSRTDATPPPFAPLNVAIRDVHKTGLGSSAAMVTSLTSALYLHWTSSSSSTSSSAPDRKLLHNLAQYVHSLAQGKVGSGFDVSAAVWGSQIYRRFAVECLGDLLSRPEGQRVTGKELLEVLSPEQNPAWSHASTAALVSPFALPPGTTLMLADVDAGSNTPSMISKVLAWKKRAPQQADDQWNALKESNMALAKEFAIMGKLAKRGNVELREEEAGDARTTHDQWEAAPHFLNSTKYIQTTRRLMREMGELSSVPIEPPEQTRLLDACCSLPDVIGAGVPGAGGYDAIWVLVMAPVVDAAATESSPAELVEVLLRGWKEMSVRPLSRNAWVHGGLDAGQSGLLVEQIGSVEGLQAAVDRC